MTNGSIILSENQSIFSAVSQVHFEYYNDEALLQSQLSNNNDVQCIVGKKNVVAGSAQKPSLTDYADGVDTIAFLKRL